MSYELRVISKQPRADNNSYREDDVLRIVLTEEQWKSVRKAILVDLSASAGIDELS